MIILQCLCCWAHSSCHACYALPLPNCHCQVASSSSGDVQQNPTLIIRHYSSAVLLKSHHPQSSDSDYSFPMAVVANDCRWRAQKLLLLGKVEVEPSQTTLHDKTDKREEVAMALATRASSGEGLDDTSSVLWKSEMRGPDASEANS